VLAAGRAKSPEAGQALEILCRTYWQPLYAYARRLGQSPPDAEDLTQGFFAHFLRRNYFEGLHRDRGRFRAFLLAAFKHFLANEWDRQRRLKRVGGIAPIALDLESAESLYRAHLSDPLSPDRLYDRAWALIVSLLLRLARTAWFNSIPTCTVIHECMKCPG
jgi:DNA-directed RNA polymerase specialized sigma24 family protein